MKYRKLPVVVEAFQLGVDPMPDWFVEMINVYPPILYLYAYGPSEVEADINTLEGWHHAYSGDFIIRGVKDEIYSCKPDIFKMTYEAVE